MKSKADAWLYICAIVAIAVALFVPLPALDASVSPVELRPVTWVPVLAWFLAAAAFWAFKQRFWPPDTRENRRMNRGILQLVLQAILLRAAFEISAAHGSSPLPWLPQDAWIWVPWFLVPGLATLLLGGRMGVLVCLGSVLLLYLLLDPGRWPLIGCMTSALAGVLLIRRSATRTRVLRAGAGTGVALGMVAAVHYAMQGVPVELICGAALVPLFIGVFSAFLVLAVLPVFEWMAGELSDVRLIEYGTDHPLLDQLRTEAPGTWHHSLNVADLAEKAAAEIGARALFCKTSALYHDIGKLKEPSMFAENNDGPSPHETLDPQLSARKIIDHVAHGVELARKHSLPRAFREIIAEHHGISVVRFFYAKACQPLPDGTQPVVDRAAFAYPGPAPSTRESGIIALADAIEAASRSMPLRSESELRGFVRKLLAERISEGELAWCPLTLADLAKVEAAFVGWLKGRNHFRPAYPGKDPEPADRNLSLQSKSAANMPA